MKYEDIFIETKEPFSHKPTHMKETNQTPPTHRPDMETFSTFCIINYTKLFKNYIKTSHDHKKTDKNLREFTTYSHLKTIFAATSARTLASCDRR